MQERGSKKVGFYLTGVGWWGEASQIRRKTLSFAHPEPRPSPLSTNVSEVTAGTKLAAGGEEELAERVLVGTA